MAILKVPVTKGKADIDVDTDVLPENVYKEVIAQGLKVLLNRGMTKITTKDLKGVDLEKAKQAAMDKAAETLAALMEGKVKVTASKSAADKISGEVMTEARRIAKNLVKAAMKREGIKVTHVAGSEITTAANNLIEAKPQLIEQAKANITERNQVEVDASIVTAIPVDEDKKAKAEAKAAEAKANKPLSAKQAGQTTKRKPQAAAQATAH